MEPQELHAADVAADRVPPESRQRLIDTSLLNGSFVRDDWIRDALLNLAERSAASPYICVPTSPDTGDRSEEFRGCRPRDGCPLEG